MSDRIEKQIVLKATKARVWRALTDAKEFGTWFRVNLDGPFVIGKHTTGRITIPGFDHVTMDVEVERMEDERLFAFRWHPYAIDPKVDYSAEPATLVEFRLDEVKGGTQLTVVESGFDKLPASRRDEAFRMNEGGWAAQLEHIESHVAG